LPFDKAAFINPFDVDRFGPSGERALVARGRPKLGRGFRSVESAAADREVRKQYDQLPAEGSFFEGQKTQASRGVVFLPARAFFEYMQLPWHSKASKST
jgi:hypothetical protein